MPTSAQTPSNPLLNAVLEDVKNRQEWNRIDDEILKRRRGRRKAKKLKPYPGAPNTLVPIVDDVTREKTDQELTMTRNAPLLAHFVRIDSETPEQDMKSAQAAFDTFLRYIVQILPKLEEGMDTKNARGFGVFKVTRTDFPRFGEYPDCDAVDPKDLIVPYYVKDLQLSPRLTYVQRYPPEDVQKIGKRRGWRNVDAVIAAAKKESRSEAGKTGENDALEVVANMVGLTTGGKDSQTVVIWEAYHYATDWDVAQDVTHTLQAGDKCCTIFSPDAPALVLDVFPWREKDTVTVLESPQKEAEVDKALMEGRQPVLEIVQPGPDRPWPFVQARYENRSRHYYDTRGVGHLCMDNQITATAEQNAKLTLLDYYQQPLLTGETRNSQNVTFEPGSFLPPGVSFATPPPIPAQFDFDVDMHKREAARRAGALSQYEFSGNVSTTRKVQKTATEIQHESARGGMVSSSSVDRFNDPLGELYMQLWDDLKRMGKPLPIIVNQTFRGMFQGDLYGRIKAFIVPAASAKTLNPDLQFQKAQAALTFLWQFKDVVPVQIEDALRDTLAHWDPSIGARWMPAQNPGEPGAMPPLYMIIKQLTEAVDQINQALKQIAGKVEEHEQIIPRIARAAIRSVPSDSMAP